jgi:DNA polymerase-3 subunit gamma/tau
MEVDGASNRGIGEIRNLRETVKYLPAKNPYKVYIIDEVHALTNDAFNALLKTLEEPPSHVVFIFATTEAHKVPATILSRCQRYDFKRIKTEDIVARLTAVAKKENIAAETEALTIIARQSEGGLRDALGMMDQVIASAGEITAKATEEALGLINQDLVSQTALAAFRGDAAKALELLDKAYDMGADFRELAARVLEYTRGLTLYKASNNSVSFLELTEKEESEFQKLGSELSLPILHRHFEAWLKFQAELARHPQPRWLMEAHLIKLCQSVPLTELATLTARLNVFLERSPELIAKNLDLLAQEVKAALPPLPLTNPPASYPLEPLAPAAQPEPFPGAFSPAPVSSPLSQPLAQSGPAANNDGFPPDSELDAIIAAHTLNPEPLKAAAPSGPTAPDKPEPSAPPAPVAPEPPKPEPPKPKFTKEEVSAKLHELKKDPLIKAFTMTHNGKFLNFNDQPPVLTPMVETEAIDDLEGDEDFEETDGIAPAKDAPTPEDESN